MLFGEETIGHFISENHPLWRKREIKADDLKDSVKITISRQNLDFTFD